MYLNVHMLYACHDPQHVQALLQGLAFMLAVLLVLLVFMLLLLLLPRLPRCLAAALHGSHLQRLRQQLWLRCQRCGCLGMRSCRRCYGRFRCALALPRVGSLARLRLRLRRQRCERLLGRRN